MGERADAEAADAKANAATSEAKASLAAAVRSALPELVTSAVDAIWSQVPAYATAPIPAPRERDRPRSNGLRGVPEGLAEDRPPRRSDFAFTRQQASRRISQGVSLADYLQAFRVGQLTLWRGVLTPPRRSRAREAALLLVERIMHVIELGSTVAAEAYIEAQQHQLAEHDRLRRDLIEDLLAYRTTFAGQKRSILRAAGLGRRDPPDRGVGHADREPTSTATLGGGSSDRRG